MSHFNKQPLFCYGTIQLPFYQRYLFNRRLPMKSARLRGWRVRMGFDGYRFIAPAQHCSVTGKILWLTARQLQTTDRWEDLPYYHREIVPVRLNQRVIKAWVYTRRAGKGRSCRKNLLTTHSGAKLILRPFKDSR